MDLIDSVHISAAGLGAQSARLKVISENIANADSVGTRDGKDPYRRQTITFKEQLDQETGIKMVKPDRISTDKADFEKRYEPNNPQADADGFVSYPNVNPVLEMVDMREAKRGYEANLNVIDASKTMYSETVNLLK
jgi:flagellar basal-body rod protein FlgC